jgi:hypothetical protein
VARKRAGDAEDAPSPKGGGALSARGLDEELDALYAAPFEGFVAARREASLRLRAAGEVAAARSIATAAKPTRTAWALNQVARRQPALVDHVMKAREAAAKAQKSGDAHAIRDGARAFRDAIGEVVRAARAVLEKANAPLNVAQARRMGETLQALAADDVEREQLVAGRLTEDVEVEDPFAGLEPGPSIHRARHEEGPARPVHAAEAGAKAPRAIATPHAKAAPTGEAHTRAAAAALRAQRAKEEAERKREAEERAAQEKRRAVEEARADLHTAERAAEAARETAAVAERELARAREQADVARRALTKAEGDRDHARARAKKLGA